MAVIAFSFITDCYGQTGSRNISASRSDIFMDIGSIIYMNTASISIGHQFGQRWSAYSCAHIQMSYRPIDKQSEEYIHRAETDPEYGKNTETIRKGSAIEAGIRFWPDSTYKGIYISLGYLHELPAAPACTIGTGIYIPIWKGIAAEIAYAKTIYDIKKMSDKLKIGVGYIF